MSGLTVSRRPYRGWPALVLAIMLGVWAIWTGRLSLPAKQPKHVGLVMISHALGTVDGVTYTNSREAFTESIHRGFQWFEVDLVETADGQLVACHALGPLQRELGSAARIDEMTHRQYVSARLYRRYTPLDLSAILDLVERHPEIRLILDVKNSANRTQGEDLTHAPDVFQRIHRKLWAVLKNHPPGVIARLYPQIYAPADAAMLRRETGYAQWIFTTYRFGGSDRDIMAAVVDDPKIVAVAFEKRRFRRPLTQWLRAQGRGVWVFVVNGAEEADAFSFLGANGFYTDFLPADFGASP